tara:strand:- start:4228 stop:4452 length:225 start_codon:yes stop_codon:yes gene_type:complete
MVEKYKVAYPINGNLNSRMISNKSKAIAYSKNNPFSLVMELNHMDDFGSYSWKIIKVGPGWYLLLLAIILAVIK